MSSRFFIAKGEIIALAKAPRTSKFKYALRTNTIMKATEDEYKTFIGEPITAKVLEPIGEEEVKPVVEPIVEEVETIAKDLLKLTRDDIMDMYEFLSDDDFDKAEKKNTKAQLVEFLISVEKNY
jgi:hypothetical protein